MQAATISPAVGSLVWVEDPDVAWEDGEVVEVHGEEIKVLCTSGKTVSALDNIYSWAYFTAHITFILSYAE